jgi:hypothetical protein
MAGILTAIVVIVGIIIILSIVGIGSSFFASIQNAIDHNAVIAGSSSNTGSIAETGNTSDKTGKRNCNLKLEIVGSVTGQSFSDDVQIWTGEQSFLGIIKQKHDPSVIKYQWYCASPSIASWLDNFMFNAEDNAHKFVENNLLGTSANVDIAMFVSGDSKTTGLQLVGTQLASQDVKTQGKFVFYGHQSIQEGISYPIELNVPIYIYNVAEDDYVIKFWNEKFQVNDRNINYKFNYNLCMSGKTSC